MRQILDSARQHCLGHNALYLLCLLHERGSVTMTTAARELGITTAAMTGIADKLCRLTYAQRKCNPDDRRVTALAIQSQGIDACSAILAGLPQTKSKLSQD